MEKSLERSGRLELRDVDVVALGLVLGFCLGLLMERYQLADCFGLMSAAEMYFVFAPRVCLSLRFHISHVVGCSEIKETTK